MFNLFKFKFFDKIKLETKTCEYYGVDIDAALILAIARQNYLTPVVKIVNLLMDVGTVAKTLPVKHNSDGQFWFDKSIIDSTYCISDFILIEGPEYNNLKTIEQLLEEKNNKKEIENNDVKQKALLL